MATSIYSFQSIAAMTTSLANHSIASVKSLADHDFREIGSGIFHSKAFAGYLLLSILPVLVVLFATNERLFKHFDFRTSRLPPGPSGWPLIGNIPWLFRARKTPASFAKFAQEIESYGEMTTVKMGARTWVFLNSNRVVKEIIAKQAAVTGERPDFPVSAGLVSRNNRTVLKKTAQWKEGRQLMHHLLSGTATRTYGHIQEEESTRLLHSYLHTPEQWFRHHYDYAYSVIHRVVVGDKPKQTQHELDEFRRVTVEFILSIYASIFDFFPSIGCLQPYRDFWKNKGDDHMKVFENWWAPVKKDIASPDAPPSFVRDVLLKSNTKFATENEEAMYLATSIVAAGSDNVRRAHNVLTMAMLCHPEVVDKARSELDSVLGDAGRLPQIADMEALPYISAIIKEAMRWRPVVPLIPAHHSTKPVHFEGYTFPTGTDFVINSFAVANEVDRAQDFIPERWQGRELNITEELWSFGGGRRVCVGYKIAHQELFLALAKMIYCFDLTAAGPVNSQQLNHHLQESPFPLRLSPRSQVHSDLIANSS